MFYSNYGSISCRFWDIQCRKYHDLEIVPVKGQSKKDIYHSIDWIWFHISVLYNFVPKTHRFWYIKLDKYTVTLTPGLGGHSWSHAVTVIGTDMYRSAAYDLGLVPVRSIATMAGLSRTVSEAISVENRELFPTPCIFRPRWRVPLGIWYRCWESKNYIHEATGPRKKFDNISNRVDTTHQRDRQTDRQRRQQRPRLRICI